MSSKVKTATAILNAIGPAATRSTTSTYHGSVRPSLNFGRLSRRGLSSRRAHAVAADNMDVGSMGEV